MGELAEHTCIPCKGGTAPLNIEDANKLVEQVQGWNINGNQIEKTFKFKNFIAAIDFANKIAVVAEEQNHHPDLHISWGKVKVQYSTHAIGGLSINDFIMAAKINMLIDESEQAQSI